MFDISIWELLVIGIVAVVFIGPKQIPQVAFRIGRWIAYFRNSFAGFSAQMRQQMQQEIIDQQKSLNNSIDKNESKDKEHG